MMDIDEAENRTDKTLRAMNLWNEPTLEIFYVKMPLIRVILVGMNDADACAIWL